MPTRNVVLTDHQAAFVEGLVKSGRYQNASEVLREGVRMIESREREEKARIKALKQRANPADTLRKPSRRVYGLGELPQDRIEAIRNAKVDPKYAHLDDLIKDWKP
jgi:putative addiction module CopG family antidote